MGSLRWAIRILRGMKNPYSSVFHHIVLSFFEPTCAICTVGSYASLSVCTRPKVEKIIHISISIVARGMKFGQNMDVDDPKVDLEGQGHRSKVKIKDVVHRNNPIAQNCWPDQTCPFHNLYCFLCLLCKCHEVFKSPASGCARL